MAGNQHSQGAPNFLLHIVRWGLALTLLTPLALSTRLTSPFLTAKVLGFQLLIDIVLIAAVLHSLTRKGERPRLCSTSILLPGGSTLLFLLALGLIYAFIAAFFGVDLNRSLWSSLERQDGLVLQIHFWVWLALLQWFYGEHRNLPIQMSGSKAARKGDLDRLRQAPDLHSYLRLSYWVSVAVSLTVIYEWLELHLGLLRLVPENVLASFQGRPGGIFGNPTFTGPYLVFHFFYGIYLLPFFRMSGPEDPASDSRSSLRGTKSHPRRWTSASISAAIALGLILMALLLGQMRGVLLGLIAGLFVAGTGLILGRHITFRVKAAAAALIGICLASSFLIWHFREARIVRGIPFVQRLTHTSMTELSVSSRLMTWESARQSIRDHPIIGWGANNVFYGLIRHYNPALVRFDPDETQLQNTWYDKSHNAYLDLLAERGAFGGALFLALVIWTAKSLWLLGDKRLAAVTAGSLTGLWLSNIVAFDSFGSLFGFHLFLAPLILHESSSGTVRFRLTHRTDMAAAKGAGTPRFLKALRLPASVLLVLLAAASVYWIVESGMAASAYQDAQSIFPQDPASGLRQYEAAFQYYSPYRDRERLRCAVLVMEAVLNKRLQDDPAARIREALQLAQTAAKAFPQDVSIFLSLADACNNLGLYVDKSFLDRAEALGKHALELSPTRQEAVFCLGRTYILRGQAARAVQLNRQMVSDYPDYPLGRWFLGLSLLADNQREEARKEIQQAFELGFRFRNSGEENVVKELFGETGYRMLTGAR
jgi:O-antigen ligase